MVIVRMLVTNSSNILDEEKIGNLESKASEKVMDIIGALRKEDNTVELVTHYKVMAKQGNAKSISEVSVKLR
ncbi:MAG: hypothetical protein HUJ51_03230 [Eggerthellaceae bacterium]|nr:hypothetical protein [Eggerthellaceae bacterium]